jgi:hypothetical protein
LIKDRGEKRMLSRDCDGCAQHKACSKRYSHVYKNGKVYCPDGTAHLVDQESGCPVLDMFELNIEAFQ